MWCFAKMLGFTDIQVDEGQLRCFKPDFKAAPAKIKKKADTSPWKTLDKAPVVINERELLNRSRRLGLGVRCIDKVATMGHKPCARCSCSFLE